MPNSYYPSVRSLQVACPDWPVVQRCIPLLFCWTILTLNIKKNLNPRHMHSYSIILYFFVLYHIHTSVRDSVTLLRCRYHKHWGRDSPESASGTRVGWAPRIHSLNNSSHRDVWPRHSLWAPPHWFYLGGHASTQPTGPVELFISRWGVGWMRSIPQTVGELYWYSVFFAMNWNIWIIWPQLLWQTRLIWTVALLSFLLPIANDHQSDGIHLRFGWRFMTLVDGWIWWEFLASSTVDVAFWFVTFVEMSTLCHQQNVVIPSPSFCCHKIRSGVFYVFPGWSRTCHLVATSETMVGLDGQDFPPKMQTSSGPLKLTVCCSWSLLIPSEARRPAGTHPLWPTGMEIGSLTGIKGCIMMVWYCYGTVIVLFVDVLWIQY